jgi:acetoin utilization deacetylase AcuC-like enzyme
MGARRATVVIEDARYGDHRAPEGHPERAVRLAAVHAAIAGYEDRLERIPARPATPEEILRVHSRPHLERVAEAARAAPQLLDPDTFVSSASLDVALLAAGAAIDLARRVLSGRATAGLAAVRPPGHHAESRRAMGFCLFNNVAVAARALQAEDGVERILILDWDVHHGNGTQHLFEDDPTVLYASTHQFPFYPGTGAAHEAGRDAGTGFTLNVPMPAGCGDVEYLGALQRTLVPVARTFRPEIILVSCGFDAHREDPLGGMDLTRAGFRGMTALVRALADDLCGGRLALVLEGGYAAAGLREGTEAVLEALVPEAPLPPHPAVKSGTSATLDALVGRVAAVHRSRYRDLGAA